MAEIIEQINPQVCKALGYKEGKTIIRVVWKSSKSGAKQTQIGIYSGFMGEGLLIETGEVSTNIIEPKYIEGVDEVKLAQLLDFVNNFNRFTGEQRLLLQKKL